MYLVNGDCLEKLKELEADSIDSVVTDPPYGLAFMGKKWDYDVPSVEIWKECLRVLKPGGHLLSFGGTRTYHRMVINIEDAGFEIRDQIMWIYGSGFPKSMDISKAIDKQAGVVRGKEKCGKLGSSLSFADDKWTQENSGMRIVDNPITDSAKQWQGWGTALKPANEPICLARKPISEKTVASNVLKHGTGAMNIDESRVGSESLTYTSRLSSNKNLNDDNWSKIGKTMDSTTSQGRWPANVIFDEEAGKVLNLQQENVSRFFLSVKHDTQSEWNSPVKTVIQSLKTTLVMLDHIARSSVVERQEEQLVRNVKSAITMSEQDAISIAQDIAKMSKLDFKKEELQVYLDSIGNFKDYILILSLVEIARAWANTGIIPTTQSLSRLFGCALLATEESINKVSLENNNVPTRFLYQAKTSKSERNAGLEGMPEKRTGDFRKGGAGNERSEENYSKMQNFHPTVKPIKLMSYLIKLITPPGGVVLDPFMGSGSTGVAASQNGFQFVGIEKEESYFNIAVARNREVASEAM